MAGTANDYIGSLNVTRSNRTCQSWTSYVKSHINIINSSYANSTNLTNRITATNSIDSSSVSEVSFKDFLNGTLYPDMSVDAAQNFCRNPSRSIAGTWCFTTDPGISDICNVRDCDKLEECIIIVKKRGEGRNVYILPQWKERGMHGGLHFALKGWDPDLTEGVIFEIKPLRGQESLKLVIGANNNEKILLYHKNQLVKEKTFFHLILAGKWTSFWMQMRKGELLLGYEGVPDALFEWKQDEPSKVFEPVFMSYMSIYDNPIGVFFKCDECHLEVTSASHFNKIMPIGLWSELESEIYSNFTITMRGVGKILIPLMTIPERKDYYVIHLQSLNVAFIRQSSKDVELLHSQNFTKPLFTNATWSSFTITFSQNRLNIFTNGSVLLKYNHSSPLLFYWFSVAVEEGIVTWIANCDPPDIDGTPINGGWSRWSSWQCSVSCGGGEGFRTRTCSNPTPNIFGNMCEGTSISTGACNDFECGDIGPDTMEMIREHLQIQQFSITVEDRNLVTLENDHRILQIITKESPDAFYEWTLNGMLISAEPNKIEFIGDNIIIRHVRASDAGIYVCMLHRVNKQRVVFRVISLTVNTSYDGIVTRATLDVVLKSNAVVLGYIYSDLRQKWLLNDTVYIDYGITTLAAVSTEHFKSVNASFTGVWKCVVEQSDLHLSWVTNIVKVKVKRAPNLFTHLREDPLTAPLFSWMKRDRTITIVITSFVIFLCVLVTGGLFAYFKWGVLPVKVFERRKKYVRNRRTLT